MTRSEVWRNMLRGALVYPLGDALATALSGHWSAGRMLGVALVGATLYAVEIPWVFGHIQDFSKRVARPTQAGWLRAGLALAYFNPLWIVRHFFFLRLFAGEPMGGLDALLRTAGLSFAANLPLTLMGNAVIQMRVRLEHRFLASAMFSGLMASFLALWERAFHG